MIRTVERDKEKCRIKQEARMRKWGKVVYNEKKNTEHESKVLKDTKNDSYTNAK